MVDDVEWRPRFFFLKKKKQEIYKFDLDRENFHNKINRRTATFGIRQT